MGSSTVRFESSTTIRRPTDAVFERLADWPGYTLWMHRTGFVPTVRTDLEGPIRKGAAYFDATRMGTFHGEVTGFEPPIADQFSGDIALVQLPGDAGPR